MALSPALPMRLHLLAMLLAAPIAAAVPLNGTSNSSAPLSRCGGSGDAIDCEHNVATVSERWVGWQVPLGDAPARGWPAVVIYHGWNLWNSEYCWYATPQYSFGLYHKAEVVRDLLDSGYAVITPDALFRGCVNDKFRITNQAVLFVGTCLAVSSTIVAKSFSSS